MLDNYRDLWSGNPSRIFGERPSRAELRALRDCSAVTVVSPSMAGWLADQTPFGEKVHVVPNGYDPEELEKVVPTTFRH